MYYFKLARMKPVKEIPVQTILKKIKMNYNPKAFLMTNNNLSPKYLF